MSRRRVASWPTSLSYRSFSGLATKYAAGPVGAHDLVVGRRPWFSLGRVVGQGERAEEQGVHHGQDGQEPLDRVSHGRPPFTSQSVDGLRGAYRSQRESASLRTSSRSPLAPEFGQLMVEPIDPGEHLDGELATLGRLERARRRRPRNNRLQGSTGPLRHRAGVPRASVRSRRGAPRRLPIPREGPTAARTSTRWGRCPPPSRGLAARR